MATGLDSVDRGGWCGNRQLEGWMQGGKRRPSDLRGGLREWHAGEERRGVVV